MKNFCSLSSMLFAIIVLISFSSNTYSQTADDALRLGFPSLSPDARALGMGDSYIGLSDDAGAAFFNPAGFGLMRNMELSGGLSYDNFGNNSSFNGQSSNYTNSATRLNNLSFVLPVPTYKGSLVFAFSYHTTNDFTSALNFNGFNSNNTSLIQNLNNAGSYIPYDLYLTDTNFVTPINGHLNQSGTIVGIGQTHSWTFSGAFEAYKNLFIGLNLDLTSGTYNNTNNYYEQDLQGIYSNIQTDPATPGTKGFQTFYLNRLLDWDITGWDLKLGMLYQLENARIGLTVQFPKTYTVKENFNVNGYSQFSTGYSWSLDPSYYSYSDRYDIVTPYELGAGFSINLANLILSAQATLIDYSQLKFENANGLSDLDVNSINQSIKNELKSVVNFNVGAEYTIPVIELRLRAGYLRQPSAYQGDPSSYDRNYVTGGLGYIIDQDVSIDVGYAHGWWSNYIDNYGTNVSRVNESITDDMVILSTTFRFF
jgi:long-subunit fatty acid transport protein